MGRMSWLVGIGQGRWAMGDGRWAMEKKKAAQSAANPNSPVTSHQPPATNHQPYAAPAGACCSNFDWIMFFGTAPMI